MRTPTVHVITTSAITLLFLPLPGISVQAQQDKDAVIQQQQKEILQLRALAKEQQEARLAAERDREELKKRLVQVEVMLRAMQERNNLLLEQIRELQLQLARQQVQKGEPDPRNPFTPNPPNVYVTGAILKVDPKDNTLVQISLGTDHGLKQNHTLEVYRLKPEARYVGMIRIVDVQASQAVGRLVRSQAPNAPLPQVGDQVTPRLTSPPPTEKK